MEMRYKCTNCGCKESFPFNPVSSDAILYRDINVLCCKNCGHMDWFASENVLQENRQTEEMNAEYARQFAEYEKKREEITRQMDALKAVINNEELPVRISNEAKAKLYEAESQLRNLRTPNRATLQQARMLRMARETF